MGTWVEVEVRADGPSAARAAAEAAVRALEAAEARLSTWRDDTPLAALNRAPVGRPVSMDARLAAELGRALFWWRRTGGAFNPAVGPLVRAWDLRGRGRRPAKGELARAVAASDLANLRLHGGTAVRLDGRLLLEEGAWGKGAALDAAVSAAVSAGARWVRINAGGQVVSTAPLDVVVADPAERSRPVLRLRAPAGSVATSGDGGGRRPAAHILDPRTGRPAADFGSVTVWAHRALDADALSTALFVMGPDAGLSWAAAEPGVEAVYLIRRSVGFTVRATPGLQVERVASGGPAPHGGG